MTVTPLARTPDELRNLVEEIALGRGGPNALLGVGAIAWDGHSPESATGAFDDFRQAVRAREALATGTRVWQEFYEPEDCAGTDHAIELKDAEVADAYRVLMHGPRRIAVKPLITDGAVAYGEVGALPATVHLLLACPVVDENVPEFGVRAFRVDADTIAKLKAGKRLVPCDHCTGGVK